MKAITYDAFGGPEKLHLSDLPDPKVGPGEMLVRVHAASVNPVDWKVMSGGLDPFMTIDFPAIPGWDVAGTVERLGFDVEGFEVGDEVVAYARKDWVQNGSFAELISVPVRTAAKKPTKANWVEAASLPLAGLTAYQTLTRLGVTKGDTVLVHGASGGVGSMAVQIAKSLGARVIGTASAANHDYLVDLGAEPVEYGNGLVERVKKLAPEGVTVSVDYVGGVLNDTLAVLAKGGRFASIADPSVIESGGSYMWVTPDAADLAELAAMVDAGALRIEVSETYPLEKVADAFRSSMGGHTRGKIAITVAEQG